MFGYEAKLRPNGGESAKDAVVIPNPIQTAVGSGLIVGWQVFVKILSIQFDVFLQVWRPVQGPFRDEVASYSLVGQTPFQPRDLRFHQVTLKPSEYIEVQRGDVLGFYHPHSNPLPWSAVPCAYLDQIHKYAERPGELTEGRTVLFRRANGGDEACRQYSFVAILGQYTSLQSYNSAVPLHQ